MAIFELENISKTYKLGKVNVPALEDINLKISPGEFTTLSGPSGSGKSTLLNLLGLIDVPTGGTVRLDGAQMSYKKISQLDRIRLSKVGFIFQTFNLIPVLNAFENIEYPLLLTTMSKQERKNRVDALLEQVGLTSFRKHKPRELSGGQRQRVAIARAMVNRPKVVLADEPTANLDSKTAGEILEIMSAMNETAKTTFIFATHDPRIVRMAHRVVKLHDGKIVE